MRYSEYDLCPTHNVHGLWPGVTSPEQALELAPFFITWWEPVHLPDDKAIADLAPLASIFCSSLPDQHADQRPLRVIK